MLNEFDKLSSNYRSFIGWRRGKVNFKYTKISGQYNARKSQGESINKSVWFFGGSTMWGTGSSNDQTIPSHFNSLSNIPVYNFGETGWNSRQSLNQLINVIGDNYTPSVVIFYDGVNDVVHQCRSEIKLLPAHNREKQIHNAIKGSSIVKRNLNFILSPYLSLANKLSIQSKEDDPVNFKKYDCHVNHPKALSIAQHLINNWHTAYLLSKSKGFEFYGILQPTLFTTSTNSEYLPSSKVKFPSELEVNYNIVYPLIIKQIERYCESDKEFCNSIVNGTNWLDGTNNIFIDFSHVNSLGNKIIAQRLKSLLKK